MDLTPYSKKLVLPAGFVPPRLLRYDDIVASGITRDDVVEDVRGINASLDLIRETRGGTWPTEAVTEDEIIVDEYWHECEFRDGKSFAFILRADGRGYIGCTYLYPMGVRQTLSPELAEHDVDVSWWVTPEAYDVGYYLKAHEALRQWTTHDYPFERPYYSNARMP